MTDISKGHCVPFCPNASHLGHCQSSQSSNQIGPFKALYAMAKIIPMQCYVHLLHEGMVMGGMKTYILRHTLQKNKDTISVFQDTELLQVSAYALRKWSKLEVSPLNTIQLLANSKVLDLVLGQSQRTHIPIKTPGID